MGLTYRLNEYRQLMVFYKNIYRHYIKYGIHYNATKDEVSNSNGLIPRIIHCCWFGRGQYSDLIKKCMGSWRKVLPDYKIMLWDEDSFPLEMYPFAKQAHDDGKWAMVSDVARLHALYNNGGIYLDTDVEVIRPLDRFLGHGFFAGFGSDRQFASAVIGSKKGNEFTDLLLSWYREDGYGKDYYEIANTRIITRITRMIYPVKRNGQEFGFRDCHFYPREYFAPRITNGVPVLSEDTYTVHYETGLWGK